MTQDGKSGWADFRPSKTMWFWSCVACVVATIVIGFAWGGWVTSGTADERVAEAQQAGKAQLAATICVARFTGATDAAVQLAALKDETSWRRSDTISDAGWTTPTGVKEPVKGAAELCAERLAAMDLPLEQAAAD
jgi:hypothetical protein